MKGYFSICVGVCIRPVSDQLCVMGGAINKAPVVFPEQKYTCKSWF